MAIEVKVIMSESELAIRMEKCRVSRQSLVQQISRT